MMPLLFEHHVANASFWIAVVFAVVWTALKAGLLLARRLGRDRWRELLAGGIETVDAPLLLGLTSLAVLAAVPATRLGETGAANVRHAALIGVILGIGWLIIAMTHVGRRVVEHRYVMDVADNLRARSINTRFQVLARVFVVLVLVVTAGAVLVTFPSIRAIGAGLLASAGVAGLVIGLAARPSVETALASIQVALTEPINLDDVVIVEGEWGRIEEIRATYVVVKIWDERRLVVPLTYFIHQPFQNWTRRTADITGAVTVKVDYRTPVEAVREALKPVIEGHPNYDGRFWNVQITDADAAGMSLRVLCTARDASLAWGLRCDVREALIAWLQEHHPDCLPRVRAELQQAPEEGAATPA